MQPTDRSEIAVESVAVSRHPALLFKLDICIFLKLLLSNWIATRFATYHGNFIPYNLF